MFLEKALFEYNFSDWSRLILVASIWLAGLIFFWAKAYSVYSERDASSCDSTHIVLFVCGTPCAGVLIYMTMVIVWNFISS